MTKFTTIYNCFLGKITEDMYLELTPEDTRRDLQSMLIDAIPGFEFPRHNLYDYVIEMIEITADEITPDDFVISVDEEIVRVDNSRFNADLTMEEVNILAILMKQVWVQRQVTSIENTRMKYSGPDFKMTSQANHLSKLLALLEESRRDSLHMQRLYKRRKLTKEGYASNWSVLRERSAIN